MDSFDFAISLGPTCQSALQLRRIFGKDKCQSTVFDWQVTPVDALKAYLTNDFKGMFALTDLKIRDGVVCNTRYGTEHRHEFARRADSLSMAAGYLAAKQRHDYLCHKTQILLRGDHRLVVLLCDPATDRNVTEVAAALMEYCPALRLRIGVVHDASLPPTRPHIAWHGCDAAWDRAVHELTDAPLPSF